MLFIYLVTIIICEKDRIGRHMNVIILILLLNKNSDSQVILYKDDIDIHYMLRKLKEDCDIWGLTVKPSKTKETVMGG